MNFDDQNTEMKRTLVEASVGRVSISSHNLESILKVILFSCLCVLDDEFDKEWEKSRPLGKIIEELKRYSVFEKDQLASVDSARKIRNRFTHRLSEIYSKSIEAGEMFSLVQDLESMKREIDSVAQMAEVVLHKHARQGGVDVCKIKEKAEKAVEEWESALNKPRQQDKFFLGA